MFKKLKILDESNHHLRTISTEVTFPLKEKYKDLIKQTIEELRLSQIEEYAQKYDLRPGMGMAFNQLGIDKRIIIIVHEVEDGVFDEYVFVNPKITSYSSEMIAAEAGEGCLSVNREVEGHIKRHARVTIEGFDMNGKKIKIRAREELAIAFQHEIDHLDGILFFDHIDSKKPFYNENEIRLI